MYVYHAAAHIHPISHMSALARTLRDSIMIRLDNRFRYTRNNVDLLLSSGTMPLSDLDW